MDELLKNNLFATHAVAAAGYLALGTVLTYPLDTLKARIQVGSGPSKHLNPGHVVQRVQTFSGNSGLYRGIEWLILGRIPGVGARFGVYQLLTAFYKDGIIDNVVYVSEALMAGVAAGVMESIVSSLFEIIKLRAQVTSASRMSSSTSFVERSAISPLIARVLSGYSPDVLEDPRQSLRSDNDIGPLSPLAVSLAAGFSGSIAAAASHPFDTAKSRSQCIVLPKYVSMERKLLKWLRPGKRFERLTGIQPADRNLLFRGVWFRMARSGIASFVVVGSYYWVIDHLVPK